MWSPPPPESDFDQGKAVDLNGDLFSGRYAHILCLRESETVVSCPLLKVIQTTLKPTFDDSHVGQSVANLKKTSPYNEQLTPGFKHWVMLLTLLKIELLPGC